MINIKLQKYPNVVFRLGFKYDTVIKQLPTKKKGVEPKIIEQQATIAYIKATDIETGEVIKAFEGLSATDSRDNFSKVKGRKEALANLFKSPKNMFNFDQKERAEIWKRYLETCKYKTK